MNPQIVASPPAADADNASRRRAAAGRRVVSFECVRRSAGEALRPEDARRVAQMRRLGCASLRYWGFDAVAESAELLISELVTNALQHGRGTSVGFSISCDGATVRIEVEDDSPERAIHQQPALEAESGRGMWLVTEIADAWGTSPDGKRTWCELEVPADETGASTH